MSIYRLKVWLKPVGLGKRVSVLAFFPRRGLLLLCGGSPASFGLLRPSWDQPWAETRTWTAAVTVETQFEERGYATVRASFVTPVRVRNSWYAHFRGIALRVSRSFRRISAYSALHCANLNSGETSAEFASVRALLAFEWDVETKASGTCC